VWEGRAQRLVRFSDLTNKIIEDDAVVRIVVEQHPALGNGPVEIEASEDEVEPIRKGALSLVTLPPAPGSRFCDLSEGHR
jgi:hypothetical protein